MRLKSIELKGFKSFADKTIINFDQDITGIVGPNGCGKSNIVDAVRWVLGEQKSKSLRLEKMDNIIFNGTKDRHAANIAEVSLTLDNTKNILPTEYTSVTITRVISRDGDSEYRLNGVACRLKDIRDLFLDTGISTDTYAIIELKMIDDILNDVDKARRRLIEQAAGISKYKSRKKETLSKLQATEADLTRVEDILYEIEKSLKGLESQAKKAKQYKVFKEEYKKLTIDFSSYELMEINQIYESKALNIQEFETRILQINTQIHTAEAQLQIFRQEIIDNEKLLSDEQKQLNHSVNTIQELENDKKLIQQKQSFQINKSQQLKELNTQAEQNILILHSEINNIQEDVLKAENTLDIQKKELSKVQNELTIQREGNLKIRDQLQASQSLSQEIRQKVYGFEKEIAVKQSQLDNQIKSVQQSLFENDERQKQLLTIENEIAGFESKILTQAELLKDIQQKETENLQRISELEESLDHHRTQLSSIARILDAKQNEFKLTKNMVDSLQGFPEAIKYLKKNATWLKDALLLSDILYCEEKYRASVETVLQPYLNHFIVPDEKDALKSIQLLQNAGQGKAGFLILQHFEQTEELELTIIPFGFIPLYQILEVDPIYQPLIAHLLHQVYIAPPEFQMEEWKAPASFKGTIVSHSGHLLKSIHQLSGGSVGLFEGKRLGRIKNLEKLEKEIKELDIQVLGFKKNVQDVQLELQSCRNNSYKKTIEREQKDLAELEKTFISKKSRIDNFKEVVEKSKERQEQAQKNINELKSAILPIQEQLESITKELESSTQETKKLELNFKQASDAFNILQQNYNQNNIKFLQLDNHHKSLLQNKTYKNNQLKSSQDQLVKNNNDIKAIELELIALTEKIKTTDQNLLVEYENKNLLMSQLSENESGFLELKNKARQIEEEIRVFEKDRRNSEETISQLKDQLNEQKVKLNVLKEKLSFEFRIDLDEFLEDLKEPDISREELSERMYKVKKKLDQFGDVNPMAEEAYDEIKNRYDFIQEQKNDLSQAKDSLLETILEVDNTAKEHFINTFTAVRENFIQVFRSMFTNDDTCDLIIVNPDDILESDIEITAKPKGKRPQSINQLSGGEKTLTALSLLFALYLYKPAPFCILDEVDAPLDDTNIKKFNDAIRKFSTNSQFILVTHNKSTMAEVDNIYGVTMIKQGISRVVPVDFSHLK
ncbi:MAG TPA: chromosome segregation protein SMC [Chitinophagales bacterium]|nr:chromosome segregation protein SMC [Chitinophagales bacterium]